MSGVSTDLWPCSVTNYAPSSPQQLLPLMPHPPHTLHPCSNPLLSKAIASTPSDTVKANQTRASCNPVSAAQFEASSAELADHTGTSTMSSRAQTVPSQPAALICRIDMSPAALAMQASFMPQHPDSTAASPLDTDMQEAQLPAKRQKRVFQHGNYNRYYGYRLGAALAEDPRIQVCYRNCMSDNIDMSCCNLGQSCCNLGQTMNLLHGRWLSLAFIVSAQL